MTDAAAGSMRPQRPEPLLHVAGLTVRFGGIVALDDLSLDVARGEIVGLIGPNGAGKTTLFNALSRLVRCERGHVAFGGVPLLESPPHGLARLGLARTFQNLALFDSISVLDNVRAGRHARGRGGWAANALRLRSVADDWASVTDHARSLLDWLGLTALSERPVAALPFATRKRVELARALAAEPTLLLLDEPAGGLHHEEIGALGRLIREIRDRRGITVLLVEHHMGLVMNVSDRVVALNFGRKIAEGTPAEMSRHPEVVQAYLGAAA